MTWRVQSISEGPLILSDIGLTFRKGDIRDLDLIGRENAERSNDIKIALMKGWLKQLEKGPAPTGTPQSAGIDPELVKKLEEAAAKAEQTASAQAGVIGDLKQGNQELQKKLEEQEKRRREELARQDERRKAELEEMEARRKAELEDMEDRRKADLAEMEKRHKEQQQAMLQENKDKVMGEVRNYFDKDPLGLKTIKETLDNIVIERSGIAEERKVLKSSGDSEAEIATKDKILAIKDKKLEKNAKDIGKSVSKSADEDGIDEALDALGEIEGF